MMRFTSASEYSRAGWKSSTSQRSTASRFLRWTGMLLSLPASSTKFSSTRESSEGTPDICLTRKKLRQQPERRAAAAWASDQLSAAGGAEYVCGPAHAA